MRGLELSLALAALAIALAMRPWRLLRGRTPLLTPLLATLVILPWLWGLPALHRAPLQLQWSGAVLCLFAAGLLAQQFGAPLPGVTGSLGRVARWLMAWGDALITGMLTAIFVAFKPEWLLTWSDERYLRS